MSDTQAKIGKLLDADEPRDAIHIAVIPVLAGQELAPGARVQAHHFMDGITAYHAHEDYNDKPDGIVDPFLTEPVKPKQRFWMFLIPNTITGLRHDWSHPVFATDKPMGTDKAASEKWLRDYADRYHADYERMLQGAISKDGYCFGEDDGPPGYRGAEAEFWHHVEVVTGQKFSEKHREATNFQCAC